MDKLMLEVYVRSNSEGTFVVPKWTPGVQEILERTPSDAAVIGEALATFGEQLKMKGLGLTQQGPALLYGPNGRPVA